MPSGIAKAIGPVMTAAGIAAAFIPGGQAFAVPLITGGLSQTVSPTGVLGQQPPTQMASADRSGAQAVAPGGPPPPPEIATSAGGGQAFQATDPSQNIAQNVMANNPFQTTQIA